MARRSPIFFVPTHRLAGQQEVRIEDTQGGTVLVYFPNEARPKPIFGQERDAEGELTRIKLRLLRSGTPVWFTCEKHGRSNS